MSAEDDKEPVAPPPRDLSFRYRFDNAEFDEAQAALRVDGVSVAVEPRPLQLLAELLRRPNEVVTKDELFEAVWTGRVTVDHVLASAVNKLRKALGARAGARIVNVPRVGYRFTGTVERVVVGRVADTALELEPGQAVPGREGYRLERALDSRGLVWLARHRQLHQPRVFKFATDAERLRSLKREFTLHRVLRAEGPETAPGVARLLDANFTEPPFFLECEYEGPDLLAWAGEDNRLAAMTLAERLALFIPVVEAVAAAHEVGVLHKDIKPANVLIGGEPGAWRPVITDFGSGHVLDAERLHNLGLTAMGLTVSAATDPQRLEGTAMYLAPELLAGHGATVKSDVYALGVMLYQLLAGDLRRPLATGWQRDLAEELLQEDVAAATQGDVGLRLSSARDLAGRLRALDVRRSQRAAAGLAAEQTARMRADLQRRKARRPWLAAAFASLAVGMVSTLWFYGSSRAALARAEQSAATAQAIEAFLHRDVLEAPDREAMRAATEPTTLLQVLRKASIKAGSRFAGQPKTEGVVRRRLAEAFIKAAAWADARGEIARSLQLLLAAGSDAGDAELLAARFVNARMAAFLLAPNRRDGVAELEEAERLAGKRLEQHTELAMLAARARHELLTFEYRHAEALPFARRLLEIAEALTQEGSAERVDALRRAAETALAAGHEQEAERLLARLAAAPYLIKAAAHEAHANVLMRRGAQAREAGRLVEALADFERARAWMSRAGEGRNEFYAAWAEYEVSQAQHQLGNVVEALAATERAQAMFRRTMGGDHQYVINTQLDRGTLTNLSGDYQRALALFDEAEAIQQRAFNGRRPFRGWIGFGRATALIGLGRPREALDVLASIRELDFGKTGWPEGSDRIEFEMARARWMVGQKDGVPEAMRAAIDGMVAKGAWPWVVERQRATLAQMQSAK